MRVQASLPADENRLVAYAGAAAEMGKKDWVIQGNKFVMNFAREYFLGSGSARTYLKRKRSEGDATALAPFHRERIRLLDVGSCYNPFLSMECTENFDVVALDICPADPSVLKCNFLDLEVGAPSSNMVILESKNELISLPSSSYDVLVMSLVLSYLPTPQMRRDMVLKAKKFLCTYENADQQHVSGLLMIVEKESIFSKDKQSNELATMTRWKTVMASLGFTQIRYQQLVIPSNRAHIMIYRVSDKSAVCTTSDTLGIQNDLSTLLLHIRQDFVFDLS